ncbi:unnamed protein product [Caenorhabditis auriculariae]|uniref:Peptidase S1 domain-containing protein n=1 Tax=Caenorhabditis auriculariae TaxID=2777116 RepID=A0A8S1HAN4_9PELO|nr:unnamed protein product [Caenorhabditis auriculariae]
MYSNLSFPVQFKGAANIHKNGPEATKIIKMWATITWITVAIGMVMSQKLSNRELSQLLNNCGRFVPGYNEAPELRDFKSLYGKLVARGKAPWVVAINIIDGDYIRQVGTGTLISPRHVISVAHLSGGTNSDCNLGRTNTFPKTNAKKYHVYLNVSCATPKPCTTLGRNEIFKPLQVKKLYIPKGYLGEACPGKESYNDISIFELAKDVKFSPEIYPACLPPPGDVPRRGEEASLYGFGSDPAEEHLPNVGVLKSIDSRVAASCGNMAGADQPYMYCTNAKDQALACSGDSGSGVIRRKDPHRPTVEVVGLLSAGASCRDVLKEHQRLYQEGKPRSIFSDLLIRVSYFSQFICDTTGICQPGIRPSGRRDFYTLQ